MKSKRVKATAVCLAVSMIFTMVGCSSKGETSVTAEPTDSQAQESPKASEGVVFAEEESSVEMSITDVAVTSGIVETTKENQQIEQDIIENEDYQTDNEKDATDEGTTAVASIEASTEESMLSIEDPDGLDTDSTSAQTDQEGVITESSDAPTMNESVAEDLDTSLLQETSVQAVEDDVTENVEIEELSIMDDENGGLNTTQRNAINMLNYITVLTQEINASKQSRIFLDEAYDSIINNTYPNAVDSKTQSQIDSILDTLHQYRMLTVKRERLEYLYEQNKAQALRQAIPNPIGLLSAVQSGSLLKTAASVLYMGIDSVTSYKSASAQADLQYLKDGWELDDAEAEEIHKTRKTAFNYMLKMVNDNDLPGDYALTEDAVEEFVTWKNKTNLVSKIQWFESNQETYEKFGPYWLELAKDYYESEDYESCLAAFAEYERVSTRIFRKDTDYAEALPMAIIAAKDVMTRKEYNEYADKYAKLVLRNTDDWSTHYFIAQVYMDLYRNTHNEEYIDVAYQIALDNVNELVDEQKSLNETYIADVQEIKAEAGSTKQQKKDVKQYNKMLKENRKIELPPVSEALYLNCDLLFALLEERKTTDVEKRKIDGILHEDGDSIFLTRALDERFRFDDEESFDEDTVDIAFDGKQLNIPASYISDRSVVDITISGENETTIDDWTVKKVERPATMDCSEFVVSFVSETAKNYSYTEGDCVNIRIVPVAESPDEAIEVSYEAVKAKKFFIIDGIAFERK